MEKSIYEPLVGRYVQVNYDYTNSNCIVGKLTQTNERFLQLQPSFHVSTNVTDKIKESNEEKRTLFNSKKVTLEKVLTREVTPNLEEIRKRFQRNVMTIVDASKVTSVSDITKIFKDEWNLI